MICGERALQAVKIKRSTESVSKMEQGAERFEAELDFLHQFSELEVPIPAPPRGYRWKLFALRQFTGAPDKEATARSKKHRNNYARINLRLKKSFPETLENEIEFYVDGVAVEPFDAGGVLIERVPQPILKQLDAEWNELLHEALFCKKPVVGAGNQ